MLNPQCLLCLVSSVFRKFPVGTSIVSRRSSRSYSHQSFYQVYFESLLDICSIFFFQYQSNSGNSARHLWLQHPTVFQIRPLLHSQVLHYWFNIIFICRIISSPLCVAGTWGTTSPMSTTTTPLPGDTGHRPSHHLNNKDTWDSLRNNLIQPMHTYLSLIWI